MKIFFFIEIYESNCATAAPSDPSLFTYIDFGTPFCIKNECFEKAITL